MEGGFHARWRIPKICMHLHMDVNMDVNNVQKIEIKIQIFLAVSSSSVQVTSLLYLGIVSLFSATPCYYCQSPLWRESAKTLIRKDVTWRPSHLGSKCLHP